jgi:chromosome segregation ATPase
MITTLLLLLAPAPQEPSDPPGEGFAAASRIYQQVASGAAGSSTTLEARLETVRKRVEELRAQIEQVGGSLLSLERQEMESTLAIQTSFEGDERERRLSDLQQAVLPKRSVLEENQVLLQRDLQSATEDLGRLQVDLDLARAVHSSDRARAKPHAKIEDRVRQYFLAKAAALGPPQRRPPEGYWLEYSERID